MAKALKIIGAIAGVVSLVTSTVGLITGNPLLLLIGQISGAVAGVAQLGSSLLVKPPPARGSVTQTIIGADAPTPYVMGEGLVGGVLRYQRSYGATLNKVPNPYRFKVLTYSLGTIAAITPWADQAAVSSWYSGFLYTDTQLGAQPESNQLTPQWAGAPGWTSAHKLSGKAAIGWSLLFDKDGKRFASGEPQLGAYGQFACTYDPRLDSTFPGGSGPCRIDDESTYVWNETPALHAGQYAYGRYQNGKRVFGMGFPADAIDWACVAAWANVCEANNWTIFGRIFEPGNRWQNLTDICIAGGGQPILSAGPLSFHYAAPRIALDTVTAADIVRSELRSVTAMPTWREKLNTVYPKWISPDHNWELVPGSAVQVSSYVTADGEVKQTEWPFNLVKSTDGVQPGQLARYRLQDSRELQPIVLPCSPRLRRYRPGDCLDLDLLDELGLETPAVIVKRRFDPGRMVVWLTFMGETPGKHAFALGQTSTPPAIPALGQSPQERDEVAAGSVAPPRGAYGFKTRTDPTPLGSTASQIDVAAFDGVLDDGRELSFPADSLTGLSADTDYSVFWDLTAGDYFTAASPSLTAMADPNNVLIGTQRTALSGGGYTPPDPPPDGWGGRTPDNPIP